MKKRCDWSTSEEIYIKYHDKEWGVPLFDDRKLFAMLILEGSQAGLSWLTILKRREAFRVAYDNFDPKKMAKWNATKIRKLIKDASIIRNKLKINAAKQNAQSYLKIVEEFGSFRSFIWSFIGGKPINNARKKISEIQVMTKESDTMSMELKKRGFKFVGSTICYAYMQSVGMVNDHVTTCFRYSQLAKKF